VQLRRAALASARRSAVGYIVDLDHHDDMDAGRQFLKPAVNG
jgi:hypothetical protein